jgi:ethanolamine ammonia-lyase small subunit
MAKERDAPPERASISPSEAIAWPEALRRIRARTPARIFTGPVAAAYLTSMQLDLREAHAAARDAVRTEMSLKEIFPAAFLADWKIFEVPTRAATKGEFLLHPDLGRHFAESSRAEIRTRCAAHAQFQIAIGDGLSVTAVAAQVPALLPLLMAGARGRGWTVGQPFFIRHCRVGILNDIGELLAPDVAVLLIGERPGLATAESLSAYMAYRPGAAHTDANRNLISNIHARGVPAARVLGGGGPPDAAPRILVLAAQMMRAGLSGCTLREEFRQLEQD